VYNLADFNSDGFLYIFLKYLIIFQKCWNTFIIACTFCEIYFNIYSWELF